MIGKLIVHSEDRNLAIRRMSMALSEIVIDGIKTNIPLHQKLITNAAFIAGGTSLPGRRVRT